MHLNKHISPSQQLQKCMTYEARFFSEHWKLILDSKNAKEMTQKIYGFPDNMI